MKKLLSLIGGVSLVGASTLSVISCGQPAVFQHPAANLQEIITERNLGRFNNIPNNKMVLDQVASLNKRLNEDEVELENFNYRQNKAIVKVRPTSTIYLKNKTAEVYFTYLRPLTDDIINDNIGVFQNNPGTDDILNNLQEWNPNVIRSEITVSAIRQNQAIITTNPGSGIYLPSTSFTVNFTVTNPSKMDFSNINIIKYLGDDLVVKDPETASKIIISDFLELNKLLLQLYLSSWDLKVTNITANSATIEVNDGSTSLYSKSVKVTFNNLVNL